MVDWPAPLPPIPRWVLMGWRGAWAVEGFVALAELLTAAAPLRLMARYLKAW